MGFEEWKKEVFSVYLWRDILFHKFISLFSTYYGSWKEQLKSQSEDWYSREKIQFQKWGITEESTLLIYC